MCDAASSDPQAPELRLLAFNRTDEGATCITSRHGGVTISIVGATREAAAFWDRMYAACKTTSSPAAASDTTYGEAPLAVH